MGTPSRTHWILTLRLPGNVERVVNDLRSELYSLTLATSTHAIPPVLPIAYVPHGTQSETVGPLPQTEITPLHVGPIDTQDETLVLTVEMNDRWCEWLRGLDVQPAPRGMPVPLGGIFLGGSDLAGRWSSSSVRERGLSFLDRLTGLPKRLSVLHVELMSLRTSASSTWSGC